MTGRSRTRWRPRAGGGASFFEGATLDMNFARSAYRGKTVADLTVSRTGTTGYADTSTGTLTAFAINTARITDRGLLCEEARTNICLQSQTFQTTWTTAASSRTADATTAPDGTTTADLITEDGTSASHGVDQSITAASNVAYAMSIYYKPNGRTWVRLNLNDGGGTNFSHAWFNCSGAGAVGTSATGGAGVVASTSIQALANGWYRCVLNATCSSVDTATVRYFFRVTTGDTIQTHAGDSTSGGYVWGAQLEAGAFATSYIPTTTGSQARGADNVSLSGAAFTDWYTSATSGTIYAEMLHPGSVISSPKVVSLSDGTNNNLFDVLMNSNADMHGAMVTATVSLFNVGVAIGTTAGVVHKCAFASTTNDRASSTNGAAVNSNTTAGSNPTVTQVHFGNRWDLARPQCGFVRRVAYIPSRVSNATLQNMTA